MTPTGLQTLIDHSPATEIRLLRLGIFCRVYLDKVYTRGTATLQQLTRSAARFEADYPGVRLCLDRLTKKADIKIKHHIKK